MIPPVAFNADWLIRTAPMADRFHENPSPSDFAYGAAVLVIALLVAGLLALWFRRAKRRANDPSNDQRDDNYIYSFDDPKRDEPTDERR